MRRVNFFKTQMEYWLVHSSLHWQNFGDCCYRHDIILWRCA